MAFMQREVTEPQTWLKIYGNHGITFVPIDALGSNRKSFLLLSDKAKLSTAQVYYEGTPDSTELVKGFGARFSAPGYLDCTPWSVFDTENEANAYLDSEDEDGGIEGTFDRAIQAGIDGESEDEQETDEDSDEDETPDCPHGNGDSCIIC